MGKCVIAAALFVVACSGCGLKPSAPPPPKNFTVVSLAKSSASLSGILKAEAEKAREAGRKPFVEFGASWCGPCRMLEQSLDNPAMIDAFNGTYIIRVDVDEWDRSSLSAFNFSSIPVFFEIDDEGKPTGRTIAGDAWGADQPEQMAPPLKKFFDVKPASKPAGEGDSGETGSPSY